MNTSLYTGGADYAISFKVKVARNGKEYSIKWSHGKLSGDPVLITIVESLARIYQERKEPVGPPCGPYAYGNYLADGMSALSLMYDVFGYQDITSVTGDIPKA